MTAYLTITSLTKYLKVKFDRDPYLERVFVTGEISGFRQRSGHQYFRLKDENAVINATLWKGQFSKLRFSLEEGMKVNAIGRIELYPPGGSYSLILDQIIPDGVGDLALKFEQLKEKLTKEGLFKEELKQDLPDFAGKIAVVTSASGAVIQDIITTVSRRLPLTQLLLYPTKVQGVGAAEEIAANIRRADGRGDIDLLIVGRGGGSAEDLWAFNEEIVVRAIFEASHPVISSVGHETDVTLADFVADHRAATPTAAAELATPTSKGDLLVWLSEIRSRQVRVLSNQIKAYWSSLEQYADSVIFRQPDRLYDGLKQRIDVLVDRLFRQVQSQIQGATYSYVQKIQDLQRDSLKMLENKQVRLQVLREKLKTLDLTQIQARGFAIVVKDGRNIKKINEVIPGDKLDIHLMDGIIRVDVTDLENKQ